MSTPTTYTHDGVTYRIGDRVICTGEIISGPDEGDVYLGKVGVIVKFDDGTDESDEETGLVSIHFDFDDGFDWWMKPGTNIRLFHKPVGLVLQPRRKMALS